jgi:plastocyanin
LIKHLHKNNTVGITFALAFIVSLTAIPILFSYSPTAAVAVSTTPASAATVQVGGGNLTNPLFGYKPQAVNVKVGETVLWYVKPQAPAEPHTVTFVFDNTTRVNGFVPSNERTFSPSIVDSNGIVKVYPPNASLTIIGTEKYVNSGWMFPAGPLPGSSSTFRVTFEKVGTYNYDCLLHPWMDGKVVVS